VKAYTGAWARNRQQGLPAQSPNPSGAGASVGYVCGDGYNQKSNARISTETASNSSVFDGLFCDEQD